MTLHSDDDYDYVSGPSIAYGLICMKVAASLSECAVLRITIWLVVSTIYS